MRGARAGALAVGIAAALTGCDGGGAPTPTPSGAPTTAATATTTTGTATGAPPGTAPATGPTAAAAAQHWRVTGEPEVMARGLAAPSSVVPLARGGALIATRDDGRILQLEPDGALREVTVLDDVRAGGEAGLLELLAWPDDTTGDTWLYAYLSTADENREVRMRWTDDADGRVTLGEPVTVLGGIARAAVHNGGGLARGVDDQLYIGTGDAADRASAQDLDSLNGKILRVTPEGEPSAGNPFGTAVWSFGHRNVQGLGRVTGDPEGRMWASELGQDASDELNLVERGGNYGWPEHEGVAHADGVVDPVWTWSPSEASPSGVAVVDGTVLVAALRGERLWAVDTGAGAVVGEPVAAWQGRFGRLRAVAKGLGSSLWVLTSNTDGRGDPVPDDDRLLRVDLTRVGGGDAS